MKCSECKHCMIHRDKRLIIQEMRCILLNRCFTYMWDEDMDCNQYKKL